MAYGAGCCDGGGGGGWKREGRAPLSAIAGKCAPS